MRRDEILDWLRAHRESVHGDPDATLAQAEREARQHAAQQAWAHACAIAERELAMWKDRSPGSHADEDCVAREFCADLARELRHLEPHPEGDETAFVEPGTLGAFEREARERLRDWIRQVAGEEEHRIWGDVVRFTRARARSLVREGKVSTASGWELTHSYAETAARLAAILAHDYEERARGAT